MDFSSAIQNFAATKVNASLSYLMTFDLVEDDSAVRTKYYLHCTILSAQVEHQSWDEDHMEERSVEETDSNELPAKLLILGNKEYIPTTGQSPITILSSTDANQNGHNVDLNLRPPPPLKAAARSRGQSLLKNNSITMHVHSAGSSGGAVSISTATTTVDESKRTQWKCKRCNYRDSNKDNVLVHVKSHYESTDQESTEERVSSVLFLE